MEDLEFGIIYLVIAVGCVAVLLFLPNNPTVTIVILLLIAAVSFMAAVRNFWKFTAHLLSRRLNKE